MVVFHQADGIRRGAASRSHFASVRPIVVLSLAAPFAMLALGAAQQVGDPDPIGPTPIEQALMEHVCGPARQAGSVYAGQYEVCLSDRLQSLRADFGADLKRLARVERKTLDSTCSKNRELGREEYVGCLSDQLIALSRRRNPAKRPASEETGVPTRFGDEPTVSVTPLTLQTSRSVGWWIGDAFTALLVGGGGGLLALKSRRTTRQCRACGVVPESGDLCSKCRHEAAEALRRSAVERVEEQRAQEEQRRSRQHDDEQREQIAKQEDEAARLRQEELARQKDFARQEEERRVSEEEERQRRQDPTASDQGFDPHVVLGVPRDASQEHVLAAYEEAKAKYAPSLVADLPMEIQAHFKAKGDAVERAYQTLVAK